MRSVSSIAAVILIGLAVGLGSAYLALARGWQPSAARIGAWQVVTSAGLREADPYARAIIARSGDLPLGAGEGVLFLATHDSEGRSLSGNCVYRITATIPVARAWSLTITDLQGRLVPNPSDRHVLTSGSVLRPLNDPPVIAVSTQAQPGNWLPSVPGEPFELVLRVYETPVANALSALRAETLPRIERISCR